MVEAEMRCGIHMELRTTKKYLVYLNHELILFKREWRWILFGVVMQYIHGLAHNLAYIMQGYLTVEQRFTLYDIGYIILPQLLSPYSNISEYFVFAIFFGSAAVFFLSIPILSPNLLYPRYIVLIAKRVLMNLSICQIFRILSFLSTVLPGPAPQCAVQFNQTCLEENPISQANCVIPNSDFNPPDDAISFLFDFDTINGCGDLMFSSHTIFTMTFLLMAYKYWYNIVFTSFLIVAQIVTALLIIASRKHYSLDVLTALYVVPMIWFLLDAYYKDINANTLGLTNRNLEEIYSIHVKDEIDLVQAATHEEEILPSASSVSINSPAYVPLSSSNQQE